MGETENAVTIYMITTAFFIMSMAFMNGRITN